MFVVIFMDQWLKEDNHISSLIGLGVSLICLLIFGADSFMIPTMITIIVLLTVFRRKLDVPHFINLQDNANEENPSDNMPDIHTTKINREQEET